MKKGFYIGMFLGIGLGGILAWNTRPIWDGNQAYSKFSQSMKEVNPSEEEFEGKYGLKDDYRVHIYSPNDDRFNEILETRVDTYKISKDSEGIDLVSRDRKGNIYVISAFKNKNKKQAPETNIPLAKK